MDNRLTTANGEAYAYTPGNQRVWLRKSGGTERFAFYDLTGQRLAEYAPWVNGGTLYFVQVKAELYFGGKRIRSGGFAVAEDRLGSTRREDTTASRFFPWGEENGSTANDRQNFATYYRDAGTGLDYASQRYYSATVGRFLTADPYMASGGAADPGSWNRYAYTRGDPVNRYDPKGLQDEGPPVGYCDLMNPWSPFCRPPGLPEYGDEDPLCAAGLCDSPNFPTVDTQGQGRGFITVRNPRKTGKSQERILKVLRWIRDSIDPDCARWLGDVGGRIDALVGEGQPGTMLIGHGLLTLCLSRPFKAATHARRIYHLASLSRSMPWAGFLPREPQSMVERSCLSRADTPEGAITHRSSFCCTS